ncbi:YhdH/YhfP family quinone oxidoreductase [Frateuria aurantia]
MTQFQAFRIHDDEHGYRGSIEQISTDVLTPGEVLVKVAWSSVNYKDALAGTGKGRILRQYPLNGGIDLAGIVVQSTDPAFREGDPVLCTGCGLSETLDGGYAEYARLPSQWAIPLPHGLSLRAAMQLGTAGFTAALALLRMEENRQHPALGPIAITGASGGVGMLGIDIFSVAGYEVHAISGKTGHADLLRQLGAADVLDRSALAPAEKPLERARFGGALDNVGGTALASLLPRIQPYGNIAICGNAGGIKLETTVLPWILRGVSVLGVASAGMARDIRDRVWERLSGAWKPRHLNLITTAVVNLEQLPAVFDTMLAGQSLGRTLVRIGGEDAG